MLWRKLFRDIKENKGAYLACVTIILIGLMLFSSLSIVMDNLKSSQQAFYYHQNFADGFVDLKAMPLSEVNRLQTIKGIKDIQGRMIKDVRVAAQDKAEDRSEEVYLRLISIDPTHPRPINDMHLLKGQHLQNDVFNIWVDNQFLKPTTLTSMIPWRSLPTVKKSVYISPERALAPNSSIRCVPPMTFSPTLKPSVLPMFLLKS
jgi:putative ABC transport system permease protein